MRGPPCFYRAGHIPGRDQPAARGLRDGLPRTGPPARTHAKTRKPCVYCSECRLPGQRTRRRCPERDWVIGTCSFTRKVGRNGRSPGCRKKSEPKPMDIVPAAGDRRTASGGRRRCFVTPGGSKFRSPQPSRTASPSSGCCPRRSINLLALGLPPFEIAVGSAAVEWLAMPPRRVLRAVGVRGFSAGPGFGGDPGTAGGMRLFRQERASRLAPAQRLWLAHRARPAAARRRCWWSISTRRRRSANQGEDLVARQTPKARRLPGSRCLAAGEAFYCRGEMSAPRTCTARAQS